MGLKAVLNDSSALTDALKPFYVEKDGKFVLDVEPVDGYALEDVAGLKTALGKERTSREKLEKDVIKFKDIDPDKARIALAELEELKKIDPNTEADKIANTKFEAAKAQLLEKHTGELKTKDDRIGTLSSAVDKLLRESQATAAIANHKGSVDLLLPHVLSHTRIKEVDGKFTTEVIDKDGNVRIADGKGTPMTIDGLVAEMRQSETFGRAFEASGHSGSGKPPGNGAGGAGVKRKSEFKTEKERAAWVDANGMDAYNKLPD
jgi:hypothetical protein